ncbi:hypothetical protein ACUY1T_11470 [Billgrantia sp. Q4P2]|uniref:hypothetical protein n=1 Tax=Billgrantia sp. Q4P2 TaxID=3463857 RepID=UPI00405707F1
MIRLTWKLGSKFLDDKGPGFAITLLLLFMAWILFWPHWVGINAASGEEVEDVGYEKVSAYYSKSAAELMRYDEDIFSRSLSILDTKKYYCLMTEYLDREQEVRLRPATLDHYETLCSIFSDAAAMVDTYAQRLDDWGEFHPELHELMLHARGRERTIGPFLTQGECIEIADRLSRAGEHTSHCMSYGQAQRTSPGRG